MLVKVDYSPEYPKFAIWVNPDHVAYVENYHPYGEGDEAPQPAAVIHFRDDSNGRIVGGTAEDVIALLTGE